ncbi:MAG: carboxypeptidase-like regulatory domain-containing protein, partial [Acidobacteriota bacterium]|nr:carboxypeptidase-like regulatory domain-containing protein [Acidobacteriota bacterium]
MTRIPSLLLSFSLVTCLVMLSSSAASAFPETQLQNRNSINGRITDTNGEPLNRLRVELLDEVEMSIKQTYSDTLGRYSFNGLSAGTFTVKAHSDGKYAGRSVRVSLYSARNGGGSHQEQLDLVLNTVNEARGENTPSNTGSIFAQDIPDNARKIYDRAIKQLDVKHTDQGMALLQEAVNIFP